MKTFDKRLRIRKAEIPEPIANNYLFLSDVPRYARSFAYRALRGIHAEHVIIATYGEEIIGFARYSVERGHVDARGTWVRAKFRGFGIGKLMWKHILRSEKPSVVNVCTVSREGRRLFEGLAKAHKKIAINATYL